MKIGLIDVDGHNFPNIVLMKLSAYHKSKGDTVEWYDPMFSSDMDIVYMSKIFSFTEDYIYPIRAKKIIKGGSGYCIQTINGIEVYDKEKDIQLAEEVEHIYPDYSIYESLTKDTAYGYLTRGCPRNCAFCHVADKEGRKSYKCANLSEFWNGQKFIKLLDPNILAYKGHLDLLQQLADSKAYVDFTQGLDIRLISDANINLINQIKIKEIHFAWDNPNHDLRPYFSNYKEKAKHKPHGQYGTVYILVNFGSDIGEDLYRIYTLRDLGYDPYVMVYDKQNAPQIKRDLQRWCNNRFIFKKCKDFRDYKRSGIDESKKADVF